MLAATLSPSYGIYSGFENLERVPVAPGSEEYLDSEKYELKERTLDGAAPAARRQAERGQARARAVPAARRPHVPRDRERALIAYAKQEGGDDGHRLRQPRPARRRRRAGAAPVRARASPTASTYATCSRARPGRGRRSATTSGSRRASDRPTCFWFLTVWTGSPFPLGASWDGEGTNFSLFSQHAERVELCLFDADGRETRHELPRRTAFNWHGYLPGIGPGARYGYRVDGPYAPADGHRFNPAKLVIDPYAKAIEGGVDWAAARVFAFPPGGEDGDAVDGEDDAAAIPKAIVIDDGVRLGGRPAACGRRGRDDHLRGPRQGLHEAPPGRARGSPRDLRRPRLGRGDRLPAAPRRDRGRAPARPPHRRRAVPPRPRPHELLGLLVDRLLRAARRLRRDRQPGRAGARVQGDGQGASSRRHRGDPRRRLQPHRRGRSPAAPPSRSAESTTRRTTASSPATSASTSTSPAPATRSTRSPRACCG